MYGMPSSNAMTIALVAPLRCLPCLQWNNTGSLRSSAENTNFKQPSMRWIHVRPFSVPLQFTLNQRRSHLGSQS